ELLSLARRQGVLYGPQLPAAPPPNGALRDLPRQLLGQLLAGQVSDLAPVPAAAVAVRDGALDGPQREAVARAAGAPALFLLQGLPGSGKSRVAAEVIAQAVAAGQRVLLLAPTAAGLEGVLRELTNHDVCPLLCLGPGESPEALPPASAALTAQGRRRQLREVTLPQLERDVAASE